MPCRLKILIDNNGILDRFMQLVQQRKDVGLAQAMLQTIERVKELSPGQLRRPMSQRQLKFVMHVCDGALPYIGVPSVCKYLMGAVRQFCDLADNAEALVKLGLVPATVNAMVTHAADAVPLRTCFTMMQRLVDKSPTAMDEFAATPDVLQLTLSALLDHVDDAVLQAGASVMLSKLVHMDDGESISCCIVLWCLSLRHW